jgi:hypothetical protein
MVTIVLPTVGENGRMQFVLPPNITYITDNFFSSLSLVEGSNVTVKNATAIFNFGILLNVFDRIVKGVNDTITITVMVIVVNNPTYNYNDLTITSSFTLIYSSTTAQSISSSVAVLIVEPSLSMSQSVVTQAYPEAGDVQAYTITIGQNSDSYSPAFNSIVTNTFSTVLHLIPGSIDIIGGKGSVAVIGNQTGDTTMVVNLNTYLSSNPVIYITYKAYLTNASLASSTITSYSSLIFLFSTRHCLQFQCPQQAQLHR